MNLCMTELRGLGSNIFSNSQGMVTSDLKRTNPDFVASNVPSKRPATAIIQAPKAQIESTTSTAPSKSIAVVSSSNAASTQLSRTLSDPKRSQDKMKQKQALQQVFLNFIFS